MSDIINNNPMIIYQDEKQSIKIKLEDESIWLNQAQIESLFQTSHSNLLGHIKNIYNTGELKEEATCRYFRQVQMEGSRNVTREIKHYNLDMIISLGYRINSQIATQFRIWATEILKEYLIKGYAMDDERLKNFGGGSYFKELLDRIRDIRSSEKVFYRQVLDLFATSSDYNKNSEEAKLFFATVQNKMHFAIHNHTASELIYSRVDSDKEFMGLTTFKGELPTLNEAKTAKNYLSESELRGLNQLVSGYLDFAERQAERRVVMTMRDWINHVDSILQASGEDILKDSGKISHQEMSNKVAVEYKKYKQKALTQVEKDYLEEIKRIGEIAKGGEKGSD